MSRYTDARSEHGDQAVSRERSPGRNSLGGGPCSPDQQVVPAVCREQSKLISEGVPAASQFQPGRIPKDESTLFETTGEPDHCSGVAVAAAVVITEPQVVADHDPGQLFSNVLVI